VDKQENKTTLIKEIVINDNNKDESANDNYIKHSAFLNKNVNSDFIVINNNNSINFYIEEDNDYIMKYSFKESNYVYDYKVFNLDLYHPSKVFVSSKSNPIRMLDNYAKTERTFLLRNNNEEIYNPIFVGIDMYGVNLYSGNNFLSKIDLINGNISYISKPNNNKWNLLSCFDFNYQHSFYLIGSYSKNLYFMDYYNNKIIYEQKHSNAINQCVFVENNPNYYVINYRNSLYMSMFDVRAYDKEVANFFKYTAGSNQKITFTIDNNILYTGTSNGYIISYDLVQLAYDKHFSINNEYNNNSHINSGENYNPINSVDVSNVSNNKKILLASTGGRIYENEENNYNNKSSIYLYNI
jgi:hypothetical protein